MNNKVSVCRPEATATSLAADSPEEGCCAEAVVGEIDNTTTAANEAPIRPVG
eukprot:CAMPEP_0203907658 /NCGR_PEP_ID=MMETSP0359-20131031/49137_1 /ASSEMBLY_ACC=CAM_ASM_000338 /TAXON_ID=268821 /ORGANISM="Scrippsiella Hangoei, Strain SHTV-5" /LENGTH=51 /DNA_ID=CAMNT_0050832511 /DNA_START=239 /DNA_END=390 /DNA_ORIENTATION=-